MATPSKANLNKTVKRTLIACGVFLLALGLWIIRDQILSVLR